MPEAPKSETARATPDSITVVHGQTLSAIADQVRPGDVSANRMMIALERANPDAFIHDNINLLKSGAVLRIPASADTQAITSAEANALVHEQVESWRQGAQPAPQLQPEEASDNTVAKTESKTSEASSATAPADHSAASKTKTAPASAHAAEKASAATQTAATAGAQKVSKPRGAHLEIVPPAGNAAANSQSGASEGGSGSELRAQLAQTKEELSARNAEVSDLKAKVGDLEKMQKDSAQLLKIRDSQLAAMQQRLADLEKNSAASPAAVGSPAAESAASSTAASASASAPSETTASASPATTTPAPATAAATPPKPATAPASNKLATKPSEPEVVQEPWYVQPFVLIGGGLLVLGGLLGLMLRRPRQAEPPPRSRFDTDALAAGMTAARTGADAPAPVVVAPKQRASQSYRAAEQEVAPRFAEPAAVPAAVPVAAAAVSPDDDDWAIPGSPTFLQAPAPAPAPATAPAAAAPPPPTPAAPKATVAPNVTTVRPAVPSQEGHQTVATKLELARAYVDIGDADGARSMLEEVLIEGNAAQQQAAFELLDTLDG
jgi:pilus assembly protein FimV